MRWRRIVIGELLDSLGPNTVHSSLTCGRATFASAQRSSSTYWLIDEIALEIPPAIAWYQDLHDGPHGRFPWNG
ncbi:MAG: hypothetical protein C5B48_08510 [Candidatus Rokuibacteriota bacterium]|nr:MAG: hypothetical protein C5B48_08510 [Candidatus Rokubacteria bacterium]